MRLSIIFMILLGLGLLTACGDEADPITPLRANAGADFSVQVGQSPRFDGCASQGDIQNYQWTILETPSNKATDVGKIIREVEADCAFTLEDTMVIEEIGEWVLQLEVRSADGSTATDTVTVTVNE
jgi:hypothetical protein